jgi:pilus assembly protein CpaB
MERRTLLIIASLLVAAAGTALIWIYVQGADARARRDWQEPVPVLVATQPIEVGSTAAIIGQRTEVLQIPRRLAPARGIPSLAGVGTRTVTVPILTGQYLIDTQFSGVSGASGVPDKRMGIALSLDDPNRVASLLHPDSHVAVYAVITGRGGRRVENLLPDVRVIAVGSTTTMRNAEGGSATVGTQGGVSTALVTLDVNGPDATKIIAHQGSLYFTLLGRGAKGSPDDNFTAPIAPSAGNG